MLKKINNKKGFTLIELIVVIAILAVLAAIIIPTIGQNIARANDARDLANSRSALATFTVSVLSGPTTNPTNISVPGGTCVGNAADNVVSTFVCTFGTGRVFYRTPAGEMLGPVTAAP